MGSKRCGGPRAADCQLKTLQAGGPARNPGYIPHAIGPGRRSPTFGLPQLDASGQA